MFIDIPRRRDVCKRKETLFFERHSLLVRVHFQAWILNHNKITEYLLTPKDFQVASHPVADIIGGYPTENCQILHRLFNGQAPASIEDCVIMNASALLFVADIVQDFKQGTLLARESLKSGRAKHVFTTYIQYTQST
jgi:anthranilate phosphoribosyltransferase